ncbi:endonuclease/exonuclease/phosphatase family protein [Psychroflexus sp. ALD_RP9]|uniref:endonuclease/exonuclease/phosphatase family protein n=1 Tax=Psychroflexus sp. ALD_RP9 TaxID=2777186 RepID=UPI001A8FF614|nr:endonuclease/exonuclease/phosphatase family protein [Psychroflexus sp. ALD_RP9]QSS96563.1 endonuclease/exonuclease/phosphatase family protein [Psychroflexus sp. ALD_RP9]
MQYIIIGNLALSLFAIIPYLKIDHWSIRFFDFPRVQFLSLNIFLLVVNLNFFRYESWFLVSFSMLALASLYQTIKIIKYNRIYPVEVKSTKQNIPEQEISILVSNVLMTNTSSHQLIKLIKKHQPDILICLETNKRWENELADATKAYQYQVKIPQENLYGMHLYSKLKLSNLNVRNLVENEVPSITCQLQLKSGQNIQFYGLHPKPPSPTENEASTERDAELLIVAKEVKNTKIPCIVCGDLNDVAWSKSTELFKKISGLLDSRIGRGRYSTFHAKYWMLRWPLDHFFHSAHFKLKKIKVLPSINSDHFPILTKLQYQSVAELVHEAPKFEPEDLDEANQTIKQVT